MNTSQHPLTRRWGRWHSRMREVQAALENPDEAGLNDAVAGVLETLYDLWEYWRGNRGLTNKQADQYVSGDPDGETTAALVHARGAKTHVYEEFGRLTDTYGHTYRSYYGVWRWQRYSDPRNRYPDRDQWYADRVASEEISAPFKAAQRWMTAQPELTATP
jgi:hypothetical protein